MDNTGPFKMVAYTQCACGMPGCCIRIAVEETGEIWFAMESRPRSLWMRIKVAWTALRGKDVGWCETILTKDQYWEMYATSLPAVVGEK